MFVRSSRPDPLSHSQVHSVPVLSARLVFPGLGGSHIAETTSVSLLRARSIKPHECADLTVTFVYPLNLENPTSLRKTGISHNPLADSVKRHR